MKYNSRSSRVKVYQSKSESKFEGRSLGVEVGRSKLKSRRSTFEVTEWKLASGGGLPAAWRGNDGDMGTTHVVYSRAPRCSAVLRAPGLSHVWEPLRRSTARIGLVLRCVRVRSGTDGGAMSQVIPPPSSRAALYPLREAQALICGARADYTAVFGFGVNKVWRAFLDLSDALSKHGGRCDADRHCIGFRLQSRCHG